MQNDAPVITIDGPAGVGKGTLAKVLAQRFKFHFLDSGATYRALALKAIHENVDVNQIDRMLELAAGLTVAFPAGGAFAAHAGGINIDDRLRSEACSSMASKIAGRPEVRAALLGLQRSFQQTPGLVADGRDMGTVVFPRAKVKIFLDASCQQRAQRRYKQLIAQGISASFEHLFDAMRARDERDRTRSTAPLAAAEDAWVIDSTEMTIDAVVKTALDYAHERMGMMP